MNGSYRDIEAWQKAIELVIDIHSCTRGFPREEVYGLASQLRRAAVSVASHIAEGKGRSSDKEFLLFLHHARGSIFEVETEITIAGRLGYATPAEIQRLGTLTAEITRMLNGLIKAIRANEGLASEGLRLEQEELAS
jgi:four helix bundle protein